MNKLTDVANFLLVDRKKYSTLTEKEKTDNFFILNRYLSKRYPDYAYKLNQYKTIDKALGLDLWYIYLRNKNNFDYHTWLWGRASMEKKPKGGLTEREYNLFKKTYKLDGYDTDVIFKYFGDEVKDEIKYIKNKIKEKDE